MRRACVVFGFVCAALPFILAGCASQDGPPEFVYGEAAVESVTFHLTETFPVHVYAVVHGALPDACTKIDAVVQDLVESAFMVTLTMRRPIDDVCAQTVTPFDARVPLAVEGLRAGVYTVTVNGVSGYFELEEDNLVPYR